MIEQLKGTHETVHFKENTNLRLYDNSKYEHYPAHWHSPLEILMPTEHDYTAICCNTTYHLNTYDILIICPGVIHSLYAPSQGRRIIFQADLTMLHQIKELESVLSYISPTFLISQEEDSTIHKEIKDLLLSIKKEYLTNEALNEASIYSKLIELFVIIGRNQKKEKEYFDDNNNKQREYKDKFIWICNYISENCTESLTLDDVSQLAGFSKYHFSRLFKQFTNVSFYQYLTMKRISIAENLLINPQISIMEVSQQSGFPSISAFIRMFKLTKSCTPTEFRNMYTNDLSNTM